MLKLIRSQLLRKRVFWFLFVSGGFSVSILLVAHSFSIEQGLIGHYYDNVEWAGAPMITVRDESITLPRMDHEIFEISTNYSILWMGTVYIPEPGEYQFTTASDDGSALFIDDRLIVDNGGYHGFQERSGTVSLEKGAHSITVRYMQGDGTAAFHVYWTKPGHKQELLPSHALFPQGPRKVALLLLARRVFSIGLLIIKVFWLVCVPFVGLILLLKRYSYKQILSYIDGHFLLLLLFLFVINLPYFAPSFFVVPGHDTMSITSTFFFCYNEYFVNNEFPLWMPYHVYGSISDFDISVAMSPAYYFVAFAGKLLAVKDTLLLFKLAMLTEQLVLLVGVYLLAKRLFSNKTTMLFVCIGSTAVSGFWALQIILKFRLYYLIPLVLFFLIKFYDTGDYKYLPLAGIIALLHFVNSIYLVVFLFFLYLVFTIVLLLPKIRQVFPHLRTLFKPSSVLFTLIFIAIAMVYVSHTRQMFNYTLSYSPGRDPLTNEISLMNFLTYGSYITPEYLLEIIYAVPVHSEQTFYIGLIPLVFFVYAFLKSSQDHIVKALLITAVVILACSISYFTFIAPLAYFIIPLFSYFRHLGYIRSPLTILLLLGSGVGVDACLNSSRRNSSNGLSIIWIGGGLLALIFFLDTVAFKGVSPYAPRDSYLQNPQLFQFHYIALCILIIFLFLLYRATILSIGNIRVILIICFLVEMTSYHYFFLLNAPITIPEPKKQRYETAKHYAKKLNLLKNSLNVREYQFQDARATPDQVSEMIARSAPLFNQYWGAKYSTLYYGAYVDPCLQEYRIGSPMLLSVDRLVRARLAIPLDEPLVGEAPLPNDLAREGFELTKQSLQNLRDEGFPEKLVEALKPLKYQGFVEKDEFLEAVERQIGREQTVSYQEQILKHAGRVDPVFLRAFGCEAPKLFLTTQVQIANNLTEAAEIIHTSQTLDTVPVLLFSETGNIIESLPQSAASEESPGSVQVTRFTANSLNVQADVTAPSGAWLIYLDAYHPGWTATVNGQPRSIVTANLAFKAIYLDSGLNEVRFRFRGNGWNRIYVQFFFVLGIVSTCLLIVTVIWLSIPAFFESCLKKFHQNRHNRRARK